MNASIQAIIVGECGHRWRAPDETLTPETDLVCPQCGFVEHLSANQIALIAANRRDPTPVA